MVTTITHTSIRKSRTWKQSGEVSSGLATCASPVSDAGSPVVPCSTSSPLAEGVWARVRWLGRSEVPRRGALGACASLASCRQQWPTRRMAARPGRGSVLSAGTSSCRAAPSPSTAFGVIGPPVLVGSPWPLAPPGPHSLSVPVGTHQHLHPRGAGGLPGRVWRSPGGWGLAPCTQSRLSGGTSEQGTGAPRGWAPPPPPAPQCPGSAPRAQDIALVPGPPHAPPLPRTPRGPPVPPSRRGRSPPGQGSEPGKGRPRSRPHSPHREPPRRRRSPAPPAAGPRIPGGLHRAGAGGGAERSGHCRDQARPRPLRGRARDPGTGPAPIPCVLGPTAPAPPPVPTPAPFLPAPPTLPSPASRQPAVPRSPAVSRSPFPAPVRAPASSGTAATARGPNRPGAGPGTPRPSYQGRTPGRSLPGAGCPPEAAPGFASSGCGQTRRVTAGPAPAPAGCDRREGGDGDAAGLRPPCGERCPGARPELSGT